MYPNQPCEPCTNCQPEENPTPPVLPPACEGEVCVEIVTANCVRYTGDPVACLQIATNDNINSIVKKVADKICELYYKPKCYIAEADIADAPTLSTLYLSYTIPGQFTATVEEFNEPFTYQNMRTKVICSSTEPFFCNSSGELVATSNNSVITGVIGGCSTEVACSTPTLIYSAVLSQGETEQHACDNMVAQHDLQSVYITKTSALLEPGDTVYIAALPLVPITLSGMNDENIVAIKDNSGVSTIYRVSSNGVVTAMIGTCNIE